MNGRRPHETCHACRARSRRSGGGVRSGRRRGRPGHELRPAPGLSCREARRRRAEVDAGVLPRQRAGAHRFLHRASGRVADVPRAYGAGEPGRGAAGGRDPRMRCDLHQGQGAGLPARAERPAHDDEHRGDGSRREVHAALPAGLGRYRSDGGMPDLGPDARGIQVARAEDGFLRCDRRDGRGLSRRRRAVPHHALFRRGGADDARGIDRTLPLARGQVHARAQGAVGRDAVRRLHAGGLRPEAGRRIRGR